MEFIVFPYTILCGWILIRFLIGIGQDDHFIHWSRGTRVVAVSVATFTQLFVSDAMTSFVSASSISSVLTNPASLSVLVPIGIAIWFAEHVREQTIDIRYRQERAELLK